MMTPGNLVRSTRCMVLLSMIQMVVRLLELMSLPEGWNIINLVFSGCKVNLLALNHVATRFRYIVMLNKESVVIIIEAEEENRVEGAKISLLCMRKTVPAHSKTISFKGLKYLVCKLKDGHKC